MSAPTAPLHFPWCDPPSCDMGAEGYSAHRSRLVDLQTFSHGLVRAQLYQLVMQPGKATVPSVIADFGFDRVAVPYSSMVLFMAELESLQQPRVVNQT